MSTYAYENCPVNLRLKDDYYEIGVVVDGAFVVFGVAKKGGLEDDLGEARTAADAAAQTQAAPSTTPQAPQA